MKDEMKHVSVVEGTIVIHPDLWDELEKNKNDAIFSRFMDKNKNIIRIYDYKGGILYSAPGNVFGIMKKSEFKTDGWDKSLQWSYNNDDELDLYLYKDGKNYWGIQNEYLRDISEVTNRKELTVKFKTYRQLGLIECGKWLFLIAPCLMDEGDKFLPLMKCEYFKEINSIEW